MKNIHLLSTDKPSRLFNCFGKLEIGDYTTIRENLQVTNQHIYITSDEEIKEGDYFWKPDANMIFRAEYTPHKGCQKVVLTTDQDLIKDGVQAIPDEFLEWYVHNPSCEQVEVHELRFFNPDTNESEHCKWELYIPKEEPKQETLEEVAERYAEGKSSSSVFQEAHKKDFIEGAKWQAERIENKSEQLINELESLVKDNNLNESYKAGITASIWRIKEWFELKEWFEQFKKK